MTRNQEMRGGEGPQGETKEEKHDEQKQAEEKKEDKKKDGEAEASPSASRGGGDERREKPEDETEEPHGSHGAKPTQAEKDRVCVGKVGRRKGRRKVETAVAA